MNTKSKIIIGLIILAVIMFGFSIKGSAALRANQIVSNRVVPNIDEDPYNKSSLADLARMASTRGNRKRLFYFEYSSKFFKR